MIHQNTIKVFLLFILLTSIKLLVNAQNGGSNNWKVDGYLTLGGDVYTVNGIENRRSPFSYYSRGSIGISYKNIKIPINLSYNNRQISYGYALNRIGVTPTYKWIKGHLGWSSMKFSPLVMNRKQFLGAGVELTPGNLRVSGFYGVFENPRAIQDTLLYGAVLVPSFKRNAQGVKVGYGNAQNFIDISLFNAQDDVNTVVNNNNQFLTTTPEDNLVLGTSFKVSPWKFISLESNLALSALTKNKYSDPIEFEQEALLSPFLQPTLSTQASGAGNVKLRLILKGQSLGVEYKRIEPTYRSFGIPFMQTDIESYLGYTNLNLFKSKLNLNIQGGFQSNNLRNSRAVKTTRLITNVNTNWRVTKQFMVNARLANFTNDTEPGLLELSDTLRFTMATASAGLSLRYNSPGKENKWNVSATFNRQTINDLSPIQKIEGDIENWQGSLSIGKKYDAIETGIKGSLLYSLYDGSYDEQQRYGGGLSLDKKLMDKNLRLQLNSRYYRNDIGNHSNGFVFTSQFTTSLRIKKTQSINLRTVFIKKKSVINRDFSEIRAGLSYSLRF